MDPWSPGTVTSSGQRSARDSILEFRFDIDVAVFRGVDISQSCPVSPFLFSIVMTVFLLDAPVEWETVYFVPENWLMVNIASNSD